MQPKVYAFVAANVCGTEKVLDIGSFDVNGSLRPLFEDYTGLDMREGPNVDCVSSSHCIPYPNEHFDLVTCVEMLEHDTSPYATIAEARRVLKTGGKIVIAASGISFPKHDFPSDFWRFTADGIRLLLTNFQDVVTFDDNNEAYGVGIK